MPNINGKKQNKTKQLSGEQPLVIVTSVIFFVSKPLSYSENRSFFSPEIRLQQTKKTILSIKQKLPNSYICLLESGKKDIAKEIESMVDQYIYLGKNKVVRIASDSSKKGFGEAISLLFGLKKITNLKHFRTVIKISGRYYLNNYFKRNVLFNSCVFTFKKYTNPSQVSTRLYSTTSVSLWKKSLIKSLPALLISKSIEQELFLKTKQYNCKYVKCLGVSGKIGPNAEIIAE